VGREVEREWREQERVKGRKWGRLDLQETRGPAAAAQ